MQKERPIILFTLAYLTVASALSLMRANWEFVFYIVVVLVLGLIVLAVHKRVRLSSGVLWALSIWGLFHMLGGLVPVPDWLPVNGDKRVLYSLWFVPNLIKYDHVIHAYGFGIATIVCYQALCTAVGHRVTNTGMIILCGLAGLGLGATNEIIEFIAVLVLPDTNVGGYMNTGWDLVANAVGVTATVIAIRHMAHKSAVSPA